MAPNATTTSSNVNLEFTTTSDRDPTRVDIMLFQREEHMSHPLVYNVTVAPKVNVTLHAYEIMPELYVQPFKTVRCAFMEITRQRILFHRN